MLMNKKIFYVSEVASILGCSAFLVYNLLHKGLLMGFKYEGSNTWHITEEALQNFINQYSYSPVPKPQNPKS